MRIALSIALLVSLLLSEAARAQADAGNADAGLYDAGLYDAGTAQISLDGGPVAALSDAGVVDAGPPVPAPPPLPPPKPLPPIPAGLGRVSGRITLNGPPPQLKPAMSVGRDTILGGQGSGGPGGGAQAMTAAAQSRDIRICGLTQPDLSLQMGLNGGVLEAVLWAADGPPPVKGAHPVARVAVEACRFIPHVLITTEGAELTLVNHDTVYHNVTGTGLDTFSYALVIKDHDVPMRLKKPGLLILESKLRPWMKGYVQALPTTSWSTTDTDGSYFLDLPPGKHVIKLWHERLGDREETVDIASGETTLKDFALTPK